MDGGCESTVFSEIVDAGIDHALVTEAIAEGRRPLGYTCSLVPEPLLGVDGLLPLRLRVPAAEAATPMADTYLGSVLCPYPRSILEAALDLRYEHLEGWVFAASCDHVRRLYDNVRYLLAPRFVRILDVPHRLGPHALEWLAAEYRALGAALAERFGVDTSQEALRASIARHDEHLSVLRSIAALRKEEHPPVSGTELHRVLVACCSAPRDRLAAPLRELQRRLLSREGIRSRARLMVLGSQVDDPRFLEVVEASGGLVVADRFCIGSLPGLEPIGASGDPYESLAAHALRPTCPRTMGAGEERLREVLDAARAFRVDGVLLQTLKFCDVWGVEAVTLAAALRSAGLPVLRLEREYALTGVGQLRTRVQAFLESMGR